MRGVNVRKNHHRRKGSLKVLDGINYILMGGYVILAGIVLFQMFRYNLLAFRWLNIIITFLAVLLAIGAGIFIKKKIAKVFTLLLLIFGITLGSIGVFGIQQFVSVTSKLNETAAVSNYTMSIAVLKDSEIESVSQLESVAAPVDNDQENVQKLIDDVQKQQQQTLTATSIESYLEAYKQLQSGEVKAIVLNEAFENYKFIFYKTLVIRILMLVAVFMFVKKAEDIIPYTIVMSVITLINFLASFVWIKREVKFVRVHAKDMMKMMSPLFAVLLIANANMLYTYLDQIFLSKIGIVQNVN